MIIISTYYNIIIVANCVINLNFYSLCRRIESLFCQNLKNEIPKFILQRVNEIS